MTITVPGSGGLIQLAPDLTRLDTQNANSTRVTVTGIDASSGLTEVLALTGKYVVNLLDFQGLTAESDTVKLTIDGVVIFEETFTVGTTLVVIGTLGAVSDDLQGYLVNSSLSLEIQTATDTSIQLDYQVRPIL